MITRRKFLALPLAAVALPSVATLLPSVAAPVPDSSWYAPPPKPGSVVHIHIQGRISPEELSQTLRAALAERDAEIVRKVLR